MNTHEGTPAFVQVLVTSSSSERSAVARRPKVLGFGEGFPKHRQALEYGLQPRPLTQQE